MTPRGWIRRRKNAARAALLDVLSDGEWHYGLDMLRASRMRSGRMYPVLASLEESGVIEACWDDSEPRPKYRRRLYRLRLATGGIVHGKPLMIREGDCILPMVREHNGTLPSPDNPASDEQRIYWTADNHVSIDLDARWKVRYRIAAASRRFARRLSSETTT